MIAQSAPMLCYARALTRGDTQADDLVNDALVRAFEHRATLAPARPFVHGLLSILRNTFVDSWRQREADRDARWLGAPLYLSFIFLRLILTGQRQD